jgi:hypothetical protein
MKIAKVLSNTAEQNRKSWIAVLFFMQSPFQTRLLVPHWEPAIPLLNLNINCLVPTLPRDRIRRFLKNQAIFLE